MSCLICCCACALYMFHRGRVGNVFSIPLYVLTCKVIENKATDFELKRTQVLASASVCLPLYSRPPCGRGAQRTTERPTDWMSGRGRDGRPARRERTPPREAPRLRSGKTQRSTHWTHSSVGTSKRLVVCMIYGSSPAKQQQQQKKNNLILNFFT